MGVMTWVGKATGERDQLGHLVQELAPTKATDNITASCGTKGMIERVAGIIT